MSDSITWDVHKAWAANCSLPMSSQPPSDWFNSENPDPFNMLPPLMIPSTYEPGLGLMLACAAGLAWALYDHLITFPAEVRLVWQRRICIGSGLFGIVRYFGILCLLNLLATVRQGVQTGTSFSGPPRAYGFSIRCHGIDIVLQGEPDIETSFFAPLWFIVFWTIDIMLQMRIYALYRNNRLAIFNGAMFILGVVAMLTLTYVFSPLTCGKGTLVPGQCPGGIDVALKTVPAFWIPALAFELWLAALALHKLTRSVLRKNLLSTMVHDSIKYFALIAIGISAHLALSFYNVGDYAIPCVLGLYATCEDS
ncbi:hypothetical protein EXIGLDRAFT_762523 [Exidia glandulosa HHB12029]|uniref:DUF6533 domain-containing protein n=1 Tax=Exidia glandulosa HHB12029 TaxID=1314781 RepID=A0A165MRL6_EXIGL|nr:hypothetical protein EXIGLDRAFT_762523 [Exidia glandulosa HHB12029]